MYMDCETGSSIADLQALYVLATDQSLAFAPVFRSPGHCRQVCRRRLPFPYHPLESRTEWIISPVDGQGVGGSAYRRGHSCQTSHPGDCIYTGTREGDISNWQP
jgi:hypothetical protein